ncbi:DHH family phosphoesterase [Flavobacterium luminosum]|uniref:Bifunctional oligoribonuclease/PAP phosphatase NrnA n=1 Tax=Flavobacterium luminosum TaxID=2949086 RepID=A0ABT0TN85_9FLAO|nr:bifunctional oligoribonuclease/PAP phosphatase NrnA [Flavobacterium sp. HXWNR70]MCL9808958.1 bifunctional oligoribonuclease/PAP phosphatase NrnA [Flavobacterium sp. HXWNR70]
MMKEHDIEAIKQLLASPQKIIILPHRNQDGDSMGSTLGLYHFLIQLNHEVTIISPNEFARYLAWMPNTDQIMFFEEHREDCEPKLKEADIIFTLDFNALHRTGDIMSPFLESLSDKTFIMIDHHQAPDSYAKYVFSDTTMSSTSEMVYHFIHQLGKGHLIDKNTATCLYTGLVTDTGSFRFSSTSSTTHKVAADLIEKGINNAEIHNNLFDTSSYDRLQLLGRALQNMKLLREHKTSYITLNQTELDEHHHKKGDTEGFVNYGLSIDGIDFTAIFIENKSEGIIKISFRSQGSFDVNQFARNYFNGGGHINAAGGRSTESLEETVTRFVKIVQETKR